ncbi:CCA tRNA nucleotidyltransferase [Brevundimonas sp. Root1279]|uniref:CCA tRNA nucleotidyltransferase n=1 Tax=Brevundimonas sp. Root1279 TaxID=1736443 RepID=UPI000AA6534F|nr:CCA tRNA nucleotidyltransferase [Brevundimonas sp. Root1279]
MMLRDQPWLRASNTRAVIAVLEAAGGSGCARFVGGCVRNALMGRPIQDVDIATVLLPEETERALKAGGLKSVPTGIAHGTVTAVAEGVPFEITTLRRDVTTDGRNATVAFTDDWSEDAARRDFRLNALYADGDGRVFDPTGAGIADAEAGRIVFVGDPATRIREDYLRILRFFRFFAWYGRTEIDQDGLAACGDLAPGMTRLSAERVSSELLKLLGAPDPTPALRAMAEAGVLSQVLPDAKLTDVFEHLVSLSDDPALRLLALLPTEEAGLRRVSASLRLSNAMRDRLLAAAQATAAVRLSMSERDARVILYGLGERAVQDAVRLAWAQSPNDEGPARRLLALAGQWVRPKLPVGGKDLAELGVAPGPEAGRLLKAFEAEWIAQDFPTAGHAERLAAIAAAAT